MTVVGEEQGEEGDPREKGRGENTQKTHHHRNVGEYMLPPRKVLSVKWRVY